MNRAAGRAGASDKLEGDAPDENDNSDAAPAAASADRRSSRGRESVQLDALEDIKTKRSTTIGKKGVRNGPSTGAAAAVYATR